MGGAPAPDMTVKLRDGLILKNPVLTSSGTFGYGAEFADLIDLNALGGITTKAITPEPRAGNPPPRIIETPSGMLNAIGLENVGLEAFVGEKLPYLRTLDTAVFVNVAGTSEDDYLRVVERISEEGGVSGFEINISCPNVKKGGISFGTDPGAAACLIARIRKATGLCVITKLTPNVTDITEIARAARDAGSDALSLVNTFRGMAIDVRGRRPALGNVIGGLSGPAIKPLAIYNVYTVSLKAGIPVIGMGGITNAEDALEFIMAGASAVSVGTAGFINPRAAVEVADGLKKYCIDYGCPGIASLVGAAHPQ